jgi:hypothetical protein
MSYNWHHKKIEAAENQRIVLNFQGYILESDDGIFDTSSYRNHPFLRYSPFLESVFETVRHLRGADVLSFPRIETLLEGVTGVYDCHFRCISCNASPLSLEFEWIIEDFTQSGESLRITQQTHNEECIRRDLHRRR